MSVDRTWMTRMAGDNGIVSDEYRQGVEEFLNFAYDHPKFVHGDNIRCPCRICMNNFWYSREDVSYHLVTNGFARGYIRWTKHGESFFTEPKSSNTSIGGSSTDEIYQCQDMVLDAMGHKLDSETHNNNHDDDMEEEPTLSAKKFYQLLNDTEVPLYGGHEKHSKLSAVTKLLHFKSESGCSEKHFNELVTLIKEFLPDDNELPESYYLGLNIL